MTHYISSKRLTLDMIQEIVLENKVIALSEEAVENIEKCRAYLNAKMEKESTPIYGINIFKFTSKTQLHY